MRKLTSHTVTINALAAKTLVTLPFLQIPSSIELVEAIDHEINQLRAKIAECDESEIEDRDYAEHLEMEIKDFGYAKDVARMAGNLLNADVAVAVGESRREQKYTVFVAGVEIGYVEIEEEPIYSRS